MMVILKIHLMILMDIFPCVIAFLHVYGFFIIIKGKYKCYEHFNHKMIRISVWDGMDGKKSIWMMFHYSTITRFPHQKIM